MFLYYMTENTVSSLQTGLQISETCLREYTKIVLRFIRSTQLYSGEDAELKNVTHRPGGRLHVRATSL